MSHPIWRTTRHSVIVIVLFVVFWLLAGFVVGEFGGGSISTAIFGAIILQILGLRPALYCYYFGSAPVLAASGAHEADPGQYQQAYDIAQAVAIGDGSPMPKVYVIEDPS